MSPNPAAPLRRRGTCLTFKNSCAAGAPLPRLPIQNCAHVLSTGPHQTVCTCGVPMELVLVAPPDKCKMIRYREAGSLLGSDFLLFLMLLVFMRCPHAPCPVAGKEDAPGLQKWLRRRRSCWPASYPNLLNLCSFTFPQTTPNSLHMQCPHNLSCPQRKRTRLASRNGRAAGAPARRLPPPALRSTRPQQQPLP